MRQASQVARGRAPLINRAATPTLSRSSSSSRVSRNRWRGALVALALLAGCGEEARPLPAAPDTIELATPDFADGGPIPRALTCDGAGTAPTITWRNVQ